MMQSKILNMVGFHQFLANICARSLWLSQNLKSNFFLQCDGKLSFPRTKHFPSNDEFLPTYLKKMKTPLNMVEVSVARRKSS